MHKQIYLFALAIVLLSGINAQVQRALIIGINQYEPPAEYKSNKINLREFENLDGCINDARSINIIIQNYFGFKKENIDSLLDKAASRDAIFSSLHKLLDSSKPGDVAFIYYSGHGSYVNNSKSLKIDKHDQTIVPSDSWKEGVHDIRDKELSAIFNAFLDKNVKLTTIFDCCNNGSISRGPTQSVAKTRFMESEDWDSMDSSRPSIPEERVEDNFLIFSASRSFEVAQEYTTENGMIQGAFTYALIKAINQQPANASALSIFQAASAILKSEGKPQQPIIGSRLRRSDQTLFGFDKVSQQVIRSFPILSVDAENNEIEIQAGFAMQVSKNTELSRVDKKNVLYTIRIDTVLNLNHCSGSIIKGDIKDLQVGQLFNISKNGNTDFSPLKVWIPSSAVTKKQFDQYLLELKLLKRSKKIKWMEKFSEGNTSAFTTVFYQNNNWFIKQGNKKVTILHAFNANSILDSCKNTKDTSLYIELPILGSFAKQLSDTILSQSIPEVELVNDYDKAQYCLFGKMDKEGYPAYGFRKTNNMVFQDSLDPMPIQTDFFSIRAGSREELFSIDSGLSNRLKSLSKINYWLNLALPIDANRFMYHLEIFNNDSNRTTTNNKYHLNDSITVKMVLHENLNVDANAYHIYIFVLDGNGQFGCIYADDAINSFPKAGELFQDKEFNMFSFRVSLPLGIDTYFLLASPEPFSNLCSLISEDAVLHPPINEKGESRKQYIQRWSMQCLQ